MVHRKDLFTGDLFCVVSADIRFLQTLKELPVRNKTTYLKGYMIFIV